MGGISFEVNEDLIAQVTELSCTGKKYAKHTRLKTMKALIPSLEEIKNMFTPSLALKEKLFHSHGTKSIFLS